MNEGRTNAKKNPNDWKAGDFVLMNEHGCKNDCGPREILYYAASDWAPYQRLVRLEGVIRVDTDADLLDERFNNPYNGGNASDCLDESYNRYNPTREEIGTFYTLAALVISNESGRWLCFDREGYDYNRYVLMADDFATVWADVVAEQKAKHDAWKAQQQAEREAENAAKVNEFNEIFGSYPEGITLKAAMQRYLRDKGLNVIVTSRKSSWLSPVLTIKCNRDERDKVEYQISRLSWMRTANEDGSYCPLFENRFGSWDWIEYRDRVAA